MLLGRIFTSLFAAAMVFSATTAVAANVAVNTHSISAGGTAVSRCDDSFTVDYILGVNNKVSHIRVGGIHSDCFGGRLSLTVVDTSNAAVASATGFPVSQTTHDVPLAVQPDAAASKGVHVVIVGGAV